MLGTYMFTIVINIPGLILLSLCGVLFCVFSNSLYFKGFFFFFYDKSITTLVFFWFPFCIDFLFSFTHFVCVISSEMSVL